MKKKIAILGTLALTLLLGACSGISESEYKELESRVTALEKQAGGSSSGGSHSPLESVNENATEKGEDEPNEVVDVSDKIVTKDGYTLTYKEHGIIEGKLENVTELADGLKYAYVIIDWEVTKKETTVAMYVYDLQLSDGTLKINKESEPRVSVETEFAKYYGDENIERIEFNATPGQKGTTVFIYKVTEGNLKNIDNWKVFNVEETNAINLGTFK